MRITRKGLLTSGSQMFKPFKKGVNFFWRLTMTRPVGQIHVYWLAIYFFLKLLTSQVPFIQNKETLPHPLVIYYWGKTPRILNSFARTYKAKLTISSVMSLSSWLVDEFGTKGKASPAWIHSKVTPLPVSVSFCPVQIMLSPGCATL